MDRLRGRGAIGTSALHFPALSVSYRAAGRSAAPPRVGSSGSEHRLGAEPAFEITGVSSMMCKTTLFVATMFAAGTAFAFHCPADMKKIDDAMAKSPKLTAAQTDEVKKYRAEGETLHKAGKHQESVDTLAKAMKILDVK
jgi:preprotein translocase subunit SecG